MSTMTTAPPTQVPKRDHSGLALRTDVSSLATQEAS